MNMRFHLFQKPIYQYLLDNIDNINLIIVPVKENRIFNRLNNKSKLTLKSIVTSILILFICTVVGFVFFEMGFHDSNIIMIYLIGVLLIALITSNIICSVVSSIASVILFNFYFTMPILSLSFYDSAYLMTFVIMIIVAFLISTLTNKIQLTAASYANMANISRILLETNQILQKNNLRKIYLIVDANNYQIYLIEILRIFQLRSLLYKILFCFQKGKILVVKSF